MIKAKIKFAKIEFDNFASSFFWLTNDSLKFEYIDFYNMIDFAKYIQKKQISNFTNLSKNIFIEINLNQWLTLKKLFELKKNHYIERDVNSFIIMTKFYEECIKQFEQIENLIYKSKL